MASEKRTGSILEYLGVPLIVMWLSLLTRYMSGVIVVAFLIHLTLTSEAFGLLTCTDVNPTVDLSEGATAQFGNTSSGLYISKATPDTCPQGNEGRRLVLDLDVCCHNTDALLFMYSSGLPSIVLFAVGIPALAGLRLWWVRARVDDPDVVATMGFLMEGFKPETFFWEIVIMVRKLAIVAITVVVEPWGVQVQTYSAIAVIFAASVLHSVY